MTKTSRDFGAAIALSAVALLTVPQIVTGLDEAAHGFVSLVEILPESAAVSDDILPSNIFDMD